MYKTAKLELDRRLSSGETNLRIKYINGNPIIVASKEQTR
jgi:hypothetical protein